MWTETMIGGMSDGVMLDIGEPALQQGRAGREQEERQAHDYGEIDWEEFWRVVNGDGPCNKERLATRVKAHDDGAWAREAAEAHAAKKAKPEASVA